MFGAPDIRHCSPQDVAASLRSGTATVVDVRERVERRSGTLPGATAMPLSGLRRRLDGLPRDRPVVFVCRSGHRSLVAAAMASRHGIDARTMDGGVLAYLRAGLPFGTTRGGSRPSSPAPAGPPLRRPDLPDDGPFDPEERPMFGKKKQHISEITPAEAEAQVRAGTLLLVDVREADERHDLAPQVPSTHIPVGEIDARLSELPSDSPVAFVCKAGGRSTKAAKVAAARGLDVRNVTGGMTAWSAAGVPTTGAGR